jgi:hypothetical protein
LWLSQAAIIRFDGFEWRGKQLKVQPIIDHPKRGRVRVPERLVAYVSGEEKKTRSGESNKLRRSSRDEVNRPSRRQQSKKEGYALPPRLDEKEWAEAEMDRAARKGFLTLIGGGKRAKKDASLKDLHRQWCDAREKPQIILYKASGGHDDVDRVLVDLSPLRLNGRFDGPNQAEDRLVKCKSEILAEATRSGMKLQSKEDEGAVENADGEYSIALDDSICAAAMGVFEGERAKAKAMTKGLAILWDIPEKEKQLNESENQTHKGNTRGKTQHRKRGGGHRLNELENQTHQGNMRGKTQHRKRGGGHRQAWY